MKRFMLGLLLFPLVSEAQSVFKDGFEGSGSPGGPVCVPPPLGFSVFNNTWGQTFYDRPWPTSPSFLTPIGSWTERSGNGTFRYGRPASGLVLTTKITTDDLTNKLSWVGAQPIPLAGYGTAQAAERITVNVSICHADLYASCSYQARSGQLFYGPGSADPRCRFMPYSELYVTWHLSPKPVTPLENTCDIRNPSLGVRCDANFTATRSGPASDFFGTIIDNSQWSWIP